MAAALLLGLIAGAGVAGLCLYWGYTIGSAGKDLFVELYQEQAAQTEQLLRFMAKVPTDLDGEVEPWVIDNAYELEVEASRVRRRMEDTLSTEDIIPE
jgi:hypothetical protein